MQIGASSFAGDLDFARSAGVGMLGGIRHEFIDQQAQRNRLVGRNHQMTKAADYLVRNRFL